MADEVVAEVVGSGDTDPLEEVNNSQVRGLADALRMVSALNDEARAQLNELRDLTESQAQEQVRLQETVTTFQAWAEAEQARLAEAHHPPAEKMQEGAAAPAPAQKKFSPLGY